MFISETAYPLTEKAMENAGGSLCGRGNTCNFPSFVFMTIFVRFPAMVIANGVGLRFDERLGGGAQPDGDTASSEVKP